MRLHLSCDGGAVTDPNAHTIDDHGRRPQPKAEVIFTPAPPYDPTERGTLTIATPEPEGVRLVHFDPRPIMTFPPASRATLEALRAAVDRALAEPCVEQRCDGVFGGQGYRLALSWTGEL